MALMLEGPQLPPEVWVHVFGFLSIADKMSIRSCCKCFKKLVDHWTLWKDNTVVLRKLCAYSSQFWTTLRRRRTDSVVVHRASTKEWEQLAISLPMLSTIVIDDCSKLKALEMIKQFKNLKRLLITGGPRLPGVSGDVLEHLRKLTHFSVCHFHLDYYTQRLDLIRAVSKLSHLTSLSYHGGDKAVPIPKQTFHAMLNCLPNLKHLSLKLGIYYNGTLPDDYFSPNTQGGGLGLISLELVNYMDPTLSQGALCGLSSLQSLTVEYKDMKSHNGLPSEPVICHLKTWLRTLPQLSVLKIAEGSPVSMYADSLPESLTSLTMKNVVVDSNDMRTLGRRSPGLLHLHFDPSNRCWGNSCTGKIPKQFPQLRTLKTRHCGVPEEDFLSLHRLKHLERLEVLDADSEPSPLLLALTHQLQVLSNHRIHVDHSRRPQDPLACNCTHF